MGRSLRQCRCGGLTIGSSRVSLLTRVREAAPFLADLGGVSRSSSSSKACPRERFRKGPDASRAVFTIAEALRHPPRRGPPPPSMNRPAARTSRGSSTRSANVPIAIEFTLFRRLSSARGLEVEVVDEGFAPSDVVGHPRIVPTLRPQLVLRMHVEPQRLIVGRAVDLPVDLRPLLWIDLGPPLLHQLVNGREGKVRPVDPPQHGIGLVLDAPRPRDDSAEIAALKILLQLRPLGGNELNADSDLP